MQELLVRDCHQVTGGSLFADAAMQRFELGSFGAILAACVGAKYVGEVELFSWLTIPQNMTVLISGTLGAYMGAYLAQTHFNSLLQLHALATVSSLESSS